MRTKFTLLLLICSLTNMPLVKAQVTHSPCITNNIITPPAVTTFCASGSTDSITGSLPSGGNGSYAYQWQQSLDGVYYDTTYDNRHRNYLPGLLNHTYYFKRVVLSGGCADTSNVITITINQPIVPSVKISAAGTGAICPGTTVTFTAAIINCGAEPAYKWMKNGAVVATTSSYTTHMLAYNDVINCVVANTNACTTSSIAGSDSIRIILNGAFAYVATRWGSPNSGTSANHAVRIINTASDMVIGSIPIEDSTSAICASKDGQRIYVAKAVGVGGKVYVINTATSSVLTTIPVGSHPDALALTNDGKKLYVLNGFDYTISTINTITNTATANINIILYSAGLFMSPDGSKLYVTNRYNDVITVISTATDKIIGTIPVAGPVSICFSPDGNKLYVTKNYDNTISVINAVTGTQVGTINVGNYLYGPEYISPDGKKIYATSTDNLSTTLNIINTDNLTVAASIPLPDISTGINLTPDDSKLYIVQSTSHQVEVLNTTTNTLNTPIPIDGYLHGAGDNFIANIKPCTTCINNYWLGTINNNWENAGNWSCGNLPGPTNNVIINSGIVLLNSNVTVNTIYLAQGVSFTINPSFNLTILH